jgi:hypothetical protein
MIDTSPDSAQFQDAYIETAENTRPAFVLLRELVAHLRDNRTQLREERARRITEYLVGVTLLDFGEINKIGNGLKRIANLMDDGTCITAGDSNSLTPF